MQYLNILYFIIITYWGFRFLKSPGGIVKGALNSEQRWHYSGPELFWCLTFSTGLLAFSLIIGFDLMAVRLGVLELFCIIGLSTVKDKPIWSFPLQIYVVYLIWLLIGCCYGPSWGYGIRVILKYSYPLLICLFASAVVHDGETFIKSSQLARIVALCSAISAFIPSIEILLFPGAFWYATARAINYISIMIFSLAMFYVTDGKEKRKNLIYAGFFMLPCFLWVFRTTIMGSLVAIMAFYFIKYRLKSLPIIFGILILGVIAVFTIPSLRDKMFKDNTKNVSIENFQEGNLDMDDVETNSREAMWTYLEEQFYKDHEIAGSGTGSVQEHMYTHFLFGGLIVPHSDFVQIKCDNGLIGFVLYCCVVFLIFASAANTYWSTDNQVLKLASIVAGSSILGVFATMYSDNCVNYSMATLSMPFGFYGMMLGIKHKLDLIS